MPIALSLRGQVFLWGAFFFPLSLFMGHPILQDCPCAGAPFRCFGSTRRALPAGALWHPLIMVPFCGPLFLHPTPEFDGGIGSWPGLAGVLPVVSSCWSVEFDLCRQAAAGGLWGFLVLLWLLLLKRLYFCYFCVPCGLPSGKRAGWCGFPGLPSLLLLFA